MKLPTTKILPNLQRWLDKGETGQRRIRLVCQLWKDGKIINQANLLISSLLIH